MITQSISPTTGVDWCLFANEYTGFSEGKNLLSDIATILQEVNRVFVETFGVEVIESHPVLSVLYSSDYPVTYRKHLLIFLSAQGRFFHNQAYQYAHELCHFMVFGNTCPEYQWLDEVMCHTMSWYAMYRFSQMRNTSSGELLNFFYSEADGYLKKSMSHRLVLHGVPIQKIIRQNLDYLHKNPIDRPLIDAIAYEIYPLFCKYPELWKIVPHLDRLKSDISLNDAIRSLIERSGCSPLVGDLLYQRLLGE